MGILNVTPDSFFDGGKYARLASALKKSEGMVEDGADILEVGGESSRPGSRPVPLQEEIKRVVPVIKSLVQRFPKVPVSIDTRKSEVARQSLAEGAAIVNDISALRADPRMVEVLRKFKAQVVLMHMQENPQNMQTNPKYDHVVQEVKQFLKQRISWAIEKGLSKKNIWIDPGIGFGKSVRHNLELLNHIEDFFSLDCPVLLGCSRKSFIGILLGNQKGALPPGERLDGSLATAAWAYLSGVSILRVHDVGATKKVVRILEAIKTAA